MKISDSFKNAYMKCDDRGNDNVVVVNCPIGALREIEKSFMSSRGKTQPCVVLISKSNERQLTKVLDKFSKQHSRDFLSCDYVNALILMKLFQAFEEINFGHTTISQVSDVIETFEKADAENAKANHCVAPMQYDIDNFINYFGRAHLVILLNNIKNENIYHAINNYLGSRTHYPISVFTTEEMLGSPYMSNGQLVQPIHDYRLIDMEKFIEKENEV